MARQGGPSQGCVACRLSKRKCDEGKPTCGRCLVKGLPCSGPPDFFQTRLRDETNKFRLAQQPRQEIIQNSAPPSIESSSSEQSSRLSSRMAANVTGATTTVPAALGGSQSLPSIRTPPQIAAEIRAKFFLFNTCESVSYVVPYPGWGPFIRYLPTLYAGSGLNSSLQIATQALAYCVLALLPGHSHYATLASTYYGAALKSTNSAIADPKASYSDETLMATLLLSVYECYRPTIGANTRSLYRSHLNGAMALLRHRGLEQFQDPVSITLFRAVRTQLVNFFAHRKEHLPNFPAPNGWRSDPEDDQDDLSLLTKAALDLPGLRADAEALALLSESLAAQGKVFELLYRSAKVETALLAWHDVFESSWGQFDSRGQLDRENPPPWNHKSIHSWPTVAVASTLCTYRTYRIYLHQVRLRCFHKLEQVEAPYAATIEHGLDTPTTSVLILQQLCDQVCASIPYYLNNKDVPLGVGESFIASALISASFVGELPAEQTAYIEDLLYRIAFSERPRSGPCLIWDARIMTRMGKFMNIPSALRSN